jgi:WXXGXW repeat (2 copies)
MTHKTLLAAALAAGALVGGLAHAAPAVVAGTTPYSGPVPYYDGNTRVNGVPAVVVQGPPPAPIYEAVPASREGYIWAPGHYVWDNGRYHWRGGEWVAVRPGYAWQAAHWEQRSDGSWYLVGGTWVRSDNYAAYEDGSRGPFGDRDGDGVLNRDDRFPRNPNRW